FFLDRRPGPLRRRLRRRPPVARRPKTSARSAKSLCSGRSFFFCHRRGHPQPPDPLPRPAGQQRVRTGLHPPDPGPPLEHRGPAREGHLGGSHPKRPSASELARFLRRHPNASVITEDMQNATLEGYERQLSLPQDSKYALLMALHPRLGATSPASALGTLDEEARRGVLQTIFDFVECADAGRAKCLVVCHWPPGIRMDAVRDVVWSHIDISRKWRPPRGSAAPGGPPRAAAAEDSPSEGEQERPEGGPSSDEEQRRGSDEAAGSGSGAPRPRREAASQEKGRQPTAGPQWVILDLTTDSIVSTAEAPDISARLKEMVDRMKRHSNGSRTGLRAKEQLLLVPHFPSRALLLLKYAADRDEMSGATSSPKRERAPPKRSQMEAIFGGGPTETEAAVFASRGSHDGGFGPSSPSDRQSRSQGNGSRHPAVHVLKESRRKLKSGLSFYR
ncbi:unnamed protein product, partial [Prorocentrum cordatum]